MPFHPQPRAKAEVVATAFEEAVHDGVSLYIPGALEGERLSVRLVKRVGKRWLCTLEAVLEQKNRVAPPCPIWRADCACPLMISSQADAYKRAVVEEALGVPVTFVPAQQTLHYRSKVTLVGSNGKLGAYRRGSHDFNDLDGCIIEEPPIADAVAKMRALSLDVRYVVLRATSSGDVLVTWIGATPPPHAEALMRAAPQVKGVYFQQNNDAGNAIWSSEPLQLLAGEAHVIDEIDGLSFRVSPRSFFQVHRAQAALLRAALGSSSLHREHASHGKDLDPMLWDLYCGVGVNALSLAKLGARVHGIDNVPEAIDDARHNARLNDLDAIFSVGNVDACELPEGRPDVVVLNPPRKGAPLPLIERIATLRPHTIAYIACAPKPVAAAKRVLREYKLERAFAFDLFPQTEHVETLAIFKIA